MYAAIAALRLYLVRNKIINLSSFFSNSNFFAKIKEQLPMNNFRITKMLFFFLCQFTSANIK